MQGAGGRREGGLYDHSTWRRGLAASLGRRGLSSLGWRWLAGFGPRRQRRRRWRGAAHLCCDSIDGEGVRVRRAGGGHRWLMTRWRAVRRVHWQWYIGSAWRWDQATNVPVAIQVDAGSRLDKVDCTAQPIGRRRRRGRGASGRIACGVAASVSLHRRRCRRSIRAVGRVLRRRLWCGGKGKGGAPAHTPCLVCRERRGGGGGWHRRRRRCHHRIHTAA